MRGKLRNVRSLQWLRVLGVAVLLVGPALVAPTLSAHAPTYDNPSSPAPHAPAAPLSPAVPLALGSTIRVKDAASIAKKFSARAANAAPDYTSGVQAGAGDWEAKTAAANDTYKAAVTDAASKNRFLKGVQGKGGKYLKNATTLGPDRYRQGVQNAGDAYATAMGPVLQTLSSITLPPRGIKGTNQARADAVATALRRMKVGASA